MHGTPTFKTALILAVFSLFGFLFWRHYFPNEEKLIRKKLTGLAQDVSIPATSKDFANLTAANSVASYFTPTAEIEAEAPELGHYTINGRQEIVQLVLATRLDPRANGVKVKFKDVVVRVDKSKEIAIVELTARVNQIGQREFEMQDVRLALSKYNGDWRIAKATTVRAFK